MKRVLIGAIQHGSLIASVIAALATVASAIIFFYSLQYSRESVDVALQVYQRSLESKISARYAFLGEDEYLILKNLGPNVARRITARREPFFVFRGVVESARGFDDELRKDKTVLGRLQKDGILNSVSEYEDLMGPTRELVVEKLDVGQETELELSQFANANAVKIAETLGGIFVVRWHLDYELDPDGRPASRTIDFWVAPSNTREDLANETWGGGVSDRIERATIQSLDFLPKPEDTLRGLPGR